MASSLVNLDLPSTSSEGDSHAFDLSPMEALTPRELYGSGLTSHAFRGVRPSLLLNQVRAAVPFLFAPESRIALLTESPPIDQPAFLTVLREMEFRLASQPMEEEGSLSHTEYFELCFSAHWATCGSFVPVEVETLVQFRLWNPQLKFAEADRMAEVVIEAYGWPVAEVSRRHVKSPMSGDLISSHRGEWFAVAVAAYVANRKRNPARAAEVLERLQFEVTRQAKVYLEFKRARDGVGMLKAAALIANNLSELDRSIEAWGLSAEPMDPLVEFAYRAGHESGSRSLRFSGAFAEVGRLNRAYMAPENHRQLPLRAPKALKRSADFLLPVAPFFDEWGETVAVHPHLSAAERAEIIDALVTGWEKLKGPEGKIITYAYPRAIAGLLERYPGGMSALSAILPSRVERNLKAGLFRSLVSVPRARFEEQWAQMALNFVR